MTQTHEELPQGDTIDDERRSLFIETGNFFEANKDTLREMFTALHRADAWSEDVTDSNFITYVRSKLIGTEHGQSAEKDQFAEFTSDELAAITMPFFKKLGLVDEILPPEGEDFAEAFVGGATATALIRRTDTGEKAVSERGATIGNTTLAAGMRPREARDGKSEELLGTTGRMAGADIRDIPWVKQGRTVYHDARGRFATRFSESLKFDGDGKWNVTETDLARIALAKRVPGADAAHRINLRHYDLNNPHDAYYTGGQTALEGAASSPITSYKYEVGGRTFEVMNAPAVIRRRGDPRPTTDSTIAEWLSSRELPEGAKVLFVTSNPHADRMARSFHKTLQKLGREDIRVSMAATSAPANAAPQLFLGEIGRMIDNDACENYGVER